MFEEAETSNQSLDAWDVSQVTNMSSMFRKAEVFNEPLGSWRICERADMFRSATITSFQQSFKSRTERKIFYPDEIF
jgi:lipopolysaccharide biosynthesis protein